MGYCKMISAKYIVRNTRKRNASDISKYTLAHAYIRDERGGLCVNYFSKFALSPAGRSRTYATYFRSILWRRGKNSPKSVRGDIVYTR